MKMLSFTCLGTQLAVAEELGLVGLSLQQGGWPLYMMAQGSMGVNEEAVRPLPG